MRKRAKTPVNECKDRIQELCRQIAIRRDGGCVFRDYPEAGRCGGYANDGHLILQYDHLNSRAHSISYGDTRFGICVCERHHIFWKRQYPAQYETIAKKVIGEKRAKLLDAVRADGKAHRMTEWDWAKVEIALQKELNETP